jgi:hypothetical protein
MVQVCPRCHRPNPAHAVYCYNDGAVLNPAAAPAGLLARPLVLPSGQNCRTLEDLAAGLRQSWDEARQMIADGSLAQFLRENGRLDLARAADEGRGDPDLGLYQFLGRLPLPLGPVPRLEVYPRRLVLGPYPAGGQHQSSLRIANRGVGELQGKVRIDSDASWVRLDPSSNVREVSIHTETDQNVGLWIDTRGLATGQTYSTRLIVVTGGGLAEVPLAVEVTTLPYPTGSFRGATTPRKLAELMRRHPREAVNALDAGDIERWFTANGWAYPVVGKPFRGLAGVQQLCESLGVARSPKLQLEPEEVELTSEGDRPVSGEVVLRTTSKKWVYAHAESSAPWLRLAVPSVSGPQQATIGFEAHPSGLPEGVAEAEVKLLANAGTRLRVKVRLDVRRPRQRTSRSSGAPTVWGRALLAGALAFLLYRIVLILPGDVVGRLFAPSPPPAGTLAAWLTVPGTEDGFLRRFVLSVWWIGGVVGVILAWKRQGQVLDMLGGLVAGAAAGLAISATIGCLLILGDEIPRRVLAFLTRTDSSLTPVVATGLWLILACGWWLVLGLFLGLGTALLGLRGRKLLHALVGPVRGMCGLVGATEMVELFRFRG